MTTTSLSLLERVSRDGDAQSWDRLVHVYQPLIARWIARYRVQPSDADDLIQDVLLVVAGELPSFEHNRHPGAFRSWLRTILSHRLRKYWRGRKYRPLVEDGSDITRKLNQLEDGRSSISRVWDREHDHMVVGRLLELIAPKVSATTWLAFRRLMVDGADVATVAHELGVSPNVVYIAKSRVLRKLRTLGEGLVD